MNSGPDWPKSAALQLHFRRLFQAIRGNSNRANRSHLPSGEKCHVIKPNGLGRDEQILQ